MNKTLKIHFYLKAPKNYEQGPLPIYLRLTIDRKRMEMFTQRYSEATKWNKNSCRVSGTSKEAQQLNSYLDILKVNIYEAQRELLNAGEEVSVIAIRKKLKGKTEHKKSLLDVYSYHVQQVKELVGKQYAAGTLKKFKAALSSLEAFIKWKYKEKTLHSQKSTFNLLPSTSSF